LTTRHTTLVLALVVAVSLSAAKSYYYPEIRTDVELLEDGDVHIRQERTYSFSGSFSWAFVDLKKSGAEDIEFNSLEELTDRGSVELRPRALNDGPKSLYVEWGYSAQDEEKTFVLDYTLISAVSRYEDVAEFYWKIIEDEHEPVANAVVDITLPEPSPGLFKVYVHSQARPGTMTFGNPGTVPGDGRRNQGQSRVSQYCHIEQAGIPKNAFLEVRVLAEPGIFAGVPESPGKRYEKILNEEKTNFTKSLVRRYVFLPLGLLLMLVPPLVFLLVFYRRYGREPDVGYDAVYEHEPPRLAPPVAVPRILFQKPDKNALAGKVFDGMFATLLQLAGKGLVTVEEEKHGRKTEYRFRLVKDSGTASLDRFSRMVIDFFFGRVALGDVLTEKLLKEYGKRHSTSAREFLKDLAGRTGKWWERELGAKLLDPEASRAYRIYLLLSFLAIAPGALLFGWGLRALLGTAGPPGIIASIGAGVLCLVTFTAVGRVILRWNPKAYLEHLRWLRFRKFLTEFSAIEQAPISLLAIWEQYYVYATALGVAKEFLKNVVKFAEERHATLAVPVWYVAASGSGQFQAASFAQGLANFQSFATNFQSMVSSFSTASSSGGGFSGGGGGGGGGGSSGAG